MQSMRGVIQPMCPTVIQARPRPPSRCNRPIRERVLNHIRAAQVMISYTTRRLCARRRAAVRNGDGTRRRQALLANTATTASSTHRSAPPLCVSVRSLSLSLSTFLSLHSLHTLTNHSDHSSRRPVRARSGRRAGDISGVKCVARARRINETPLNRRRTTALPSATRSW